MEIVVIGIGNILLMDDGAGVHTIHALEKEALPSAVHLVDGGTSTIDMIGYFLDYRQVIVLDALKGGNSPGTLYRLKPEDLETYNNSQLSLHDVQILDVVKMAKRLGKTPEVLILAIEPGEITYGLEMTEAVANRIPDFVQLVKKEICRLSDQTQPGV